MEFYRNFYILIRSKIKGNEQKNFNITVPYTTIIFNILGLFEGIRHDSLYCISLLVLKDVSLNHSLGHSPSTTSTEKGRSLSEVGGVQ